MPQEGKPTMEDLLAQYLTAQLEAQKPVEAQKAVEYVTPEQLAGFLETLKTDLIASLSTQVAEQVEKAMPAPSREGAGRQGVEKNETDPRESDPVGYLVAKTRAGTLTPDDKQLIYGLTYALITDGMVE